MSTLVFSAVADTPVTIMCNVQRLTACTDFVAFPRGVVDKEKERSEDKIQRWHLQDLALQRCGSQQALLSQKEEVCSCGSLEEKKC